MTLFEMQHPSFHSLIITCEHAGNHVPDHYRNLFTGHEEILDTHRGWDPGALKLAKMISKELKAPLYSCNHSRLLIEPNRSETHPSLFSEFPRGLPAKYKVII
ncbi:MAG: N-formylglutamate amidohydrolase [Balneolaceae bacterium]|nr:N-formylglutamate amidohydrolase [Balneolaceae bacterium]